MVMETQMPPLRFVVIGARRGRTFIKAARTIASGCVQLAGICDTDPERLAEWKDEPGVTLYSDYEQVLNDPKIDAVCLATPVPMHARQAISALDARKHVLCEVPAAYTLEEAWDLVAAVERSGRTYMMAENYCFIDAVLQVQHMVELGVFGELTYASGSYIHDCRELLFHPDGELTWRGQLRRDYRANTYPTHSVGPVARWLGINRTDAFRTMATWHSRSRAASDYAARNHPERAEWLPPEGWLTPDTVTTSLQTEQGVLVDIRVDWASARPHHMSRYELQGTKASFIWPDGSGCPEPLIWIEGRSPASPRGTPQAWEPLSKYRGEYEHPLWRRHRQEAAKAGHGGGDYFVLNEFAAAIAEGRPPLIDVYDAVTWSSITPLSALSIERGNGPVEFPNFKKGKA